MLICFNFNQADRLLLLTDIVGVLDKTKTLIENIPSSRLSGLTSDGTISGGMIPKLGLSFLLSNRFLLIF